MKQARAGLAPHFVFGQEDGRKQKVFFLPGYDKRSKDPGKNYGIHGMHLMFALCGEGTNSATITFEINTNWYPKSATTEWDVAGETRHGSYGWGIYYHQHVQTDDWQIYSGTCDFGDACWSGEYGFELVRALFADFVTSGQDAVWEKLNHLLDELEGKIADTLAGREGKNDRVF